MIGICTDSNSQLPPELAARYGIEIVPLTVVIDDQEYLEGVDLDTDAFYDLFSAARRPNVTFSQPSPGQFAAAYDDLIAIGCSSILSVHTSSAVSGTLNAARLAAHTAPVPVRLVDSGTARVGVSCCVWAAAEAIQAGGSLDEAAAIAESLAPRIGNVFVLGGRRLVRAGGGRREVCVLSTRDDEAIKTIETVAAVDEAVDAMARYAAGWGDNLRVAVGTAHRDVAAIGEALADAVGRADNVLGVVQFRIGPSVGVEMGPGTVGCVMFPATAPS